MKLLLKQYLSSLKERDELDVVLPDILSENGFNVISRPKRGTTQYGVDVVAIGPHPTTGTPALYLLSIKSGDLTRDEWAAGKQALRPSLEEILEVYIPKHRPARHKNLPIVIALCFGGDIQEDVRVRVQGFLEKHTDPGKIEFEEWNGDRIADMMMTGLLRERIFPREMQSSFRKAVAFVDEPAICVSHFNSLLRQIWAAMPKNHSERLRMARQIYLATWTIFVWCRDSKNLEAAYQASTLSILWIWDLSREHLTATPRGRELAEVVDKAFNLYRGISTSFIETHVAPYSHLEDGLCGSVLSISGIDINLKLFEVLGRVSIHGLWLTWLEERSVGGDTETANTIAREKQNALELVTSILQNNKTFEEPRRDDHAIEITLTCLFLLQCKAVDFLADWLRNTMRISIYSHKTHGAYPCILREYSDLAVHPQHHDGYQEEVTAGSILYPSLALFFAIVGDVDAFDELNAFRSKYLSHCTWQFWVPDETSEQHYFRHTDMHGSAITDVDTGNGPAKLIEQLQKEIIASQDFTKISAIQRGIWPLMLTACHVYRMPIPIHFWSS